MVAGMFDIEHSPYNTPTSCEPWSGGKLTTIRLLVVEDSEFVRRNICSVLALEPEFEVVCEATDGIEAVKRAQEFQPDVVLLDIGLPHMNGFQAAPLIKQVAPRAQLLFVTLHDNPFFVREAFAAGGLGFLTKAEVTTNLGPAIRAVHLKHKFLNKDLFPDSV